MKRPAIIYFLCLFTANAFDISGIANQNVIHYLNYVLENVDNETECVKQLKMFTSDLSHMELWAFQMIDSSGRLPPGILTGHSIFIGNYDECLQLDTDRNGTQILGQYCRTLMIPQDRVLQCVQQSFSDRQIYGLGKTPLSDLSELFFLNLDVCVPAVCTSEDLQRIWNYAEEEYDLSVHLVFDDNSCTTKAKQREFSTIDIIAITVFGIIGLLILSSTVYDILIFQRRKNKQHEFDLFMAFSFYTNGKRLFSLQSNHEENKINCLNGIRVITLAWISLGHRTTTNYFRTAVNSIYSVEWFTHDGNMFVLGALGSVDTFFLISGFLIVYVIMSAREKGLKINLITFYIHRLLRLSPSIGAMILLYVGILKHLGSGPYWKIVEDMFVENCRKHWWATFLFVQNYVTPDLFDMCIVQAWYLSADTQLYVLSPLLFLPLQKWPKATIAVIVGLIAASIGAVIQATFHYNLSDKSLSALDNYASYIYTPTHLRAGPWLVGIIFGYFMFKTKDKKIYIKTMHVLLLWLLCLVTMFFIVYFLMVVVHYDVPIAIMAIYYGLSRTIWGLCVSWVIFACSRGYGGYVNKFLSSSIFNILSRLTFSIFISHILIISLVEGQRGAPPYLSALSTFHKAWGDYAFTLGFSVIWTLTFESPVNVFEKVLFGRALKKNKRSVEENGVYKEC